MWRLSNSKVNNFIKKKVQWYFREIDSENIYAENINNEKIMNLWLVRFIAYLQLINCFLRGGAKM